jgi:ribulose kinase
LPNIILQGYKINTIFLTGGSGKNDVYVHEHADITGCQVVLPKEQEAVLLGAAVLGAVASRQFDSSLDAMASMNAVGRVVQPAQDRVASYHDDKYQVFLKMYEDFMSYRKLMAKWK